LQQRLFRLHEDKTTTYDNYAKEKKRVLDLLKENRKTSGNIHVEFDETDDTEEIFKHVIKNTSFKIAVREDSCFRI
jgi:hypothetical protein